MKSNIEALERRILAGGEISGEEALELISLEGPAIYQLFPSANRLARAAKGWEVELCGIINAKSGRCAEDCGFCAQAACHDTEAPVYGLVESEAMVSAAYKAAGICADRFGIVTSGTAVKDPGELDRICRAISEIRLSGRIAPCASLGILSLAELTQLKRAGLDRYHHNLETARSFFPSICSTHVYDDDVATVRDAISLGIEVCSGGIFGLGESKAQRVELALTLRELGVASVPVNFLVPVKGTAMENRTPVPPLEALQILAVYRFLLPKATIKVCAGRDRNLGDMASWIFYAGANAMMVGDYLTTAGRTPEADLKMVRELGFTPVAGKC